MIFINKNDLKETYASHRVGHLQMNIYETSYDIPYHWHDEFEFIYAAKKGCECIINGKSIYVKCGEAILIRGGELHTVNADTDGQFFAVVFHPFSICGSELREYFSKKIHFNRIFNENHSSEKIIIDNLKRIYDCFKVKRYAYELRLKSLIADIFGIIFEEELYEKASAFEENDGFDEFTKLLEYIHTYFSSKITLDSLAKMSNYSRSYVIKLFKQNTGKTPFEYLNAYRIYEAKNLLENTNKSVLEISLECGYENIGYFIRTFKRLAGVTPLKYKNKGAKQ